MVIMNLMAAMMENGLSDFGNFRINRNSRIFSTLAICISFSKSMFDVVMDPAGNTYRVVFFCH